MASNVEIWKKQIVEGERIREQGDPFKAVLILSKVYKEAKQAGFYGVAAESLDHLIVCSQHLADQSPLEILRANYLTEMFDQCHEGLLLPVSNEHLSVFHLRLGCYELRCGNPASALRNFSNAIALLSERNVTWYEYQGHKAEGLSAAGNSRQAIKLLNESIEEVEQDTDFSDSHRLTILAGLHMRMMQSAKAAWRPILLLEALYICVAICARIKLAL